MTAPCLHYWDVVDPQTRRLAVHGGWLYMVVCYSGDGVSAIPSTAFVADPTAPHVVRADLEAMGVDVEASRARCMALLDRLEADAVARLSAPDAPAEVPAWRADADAAVALLVRAGWLDARGDDDYLWYAVDDVAVTSMYVERQNEAASTAAIEKRGRRTLTDCARIVIRDAVERGEAPDMDAARAMVAEWDAAGGGA